MHSGAIDISIVIPVFNEEDNLGPLTDEILGAMAPLGKTFEVIFINDASTDSSLGVLRELAAKHPNFRIVTHTRNSGESAGQATGFQLARGEMIITMDADRQNDPADIPNLLAALTDDVDCVAGVRARRMDSTVKRISSRTANRFRNMILGEKVSDAGCTYRALRRSCLREILVFNGTHRFIPTMLRIQGYSVVELKVNHRPRAAGVSSYGVGNRLWRGLRDCFAMRWYRKRAIYGPRIRIEAVGPAPRTTESESEPEAMAEVR